MAYELGKGDIMKRLLFAGILGLIILVGCTSTDADGDLETIKFVDAKWDSLQVHNYIAGTIMEEGYGYNTEIVTSSTAAGVQGLRQGDTHVFMEMWPDNIRDLYDEAIESGDIKKLSINFDDNAQGLYVPTYVIEGDEERGIEPMAPDLKYLEDLKKYPEVFEDPEQPGRGRALNAPSGWEVDEDIDKKFELYGLDETFNNFTPGSDSAIVISLASAYDKGEAWVGYYWEPTAVSVEYELTLLEEPEYDREIFEDTAGTAFPSMETVVAVNHEFPDQAPELTSFLSNYQTSSELTGDALAYMAENDATAEEAAIWWLKEYEEVWTEWIPEDVAEKVKSSL